MANLVKPIVKSESEPIPKFNPVLPAVPPIRDTESVESKLKKIELVLRTRGCDTRSTQQALSEIKTIIWG